MDDVYKVKCPCCTTILVIEKRTGTIVEERRPILEQSSGDRYEDALRKVRERGATAEEKFKKFQSEKDQKAAKLDALFKDGLKKATESGDDPKKVNPFDMD